MRSAVRMPADAGVTLAEVLVAMGIGAVVLTVAVAGIVQMNRSTQVSVGSVAAQSQTAIAFDRIDAELRYASLVQPGSEVVDGVAQPVLEYVNTAVRPARCYRLWLERDILRRQTWTILESRPTPAALASGIRAVDGMPPFEVRNSPDDDAPTSITVALAAVNTVGLVRPREFRATFTAPNTLRQADEEPARTCFPKDTA